MTSWRETDRGCVDPRDASVRLSAENAARVERVRMQKASRLLDRWIMTGAWLRMPFVEFIDASD